MYYLGIDVGSITTKGVILSSEKKIVAACVLKTGADMQKAIALLSRELFLESALTRADIAKCVSTGYGRKNVPDIDRYVTEITAHHYGVHFLFPETRVVIDIGGQDTKVISVDANGEIDDFVMNDKCSAGTGRFLEVMSGILDVELGTFGDYALSAKKKLSINSTCTVFAESEVISLIARQETKEDIAYAIHSSVVDRIVSLSCRVHTNGALTLTGGVSKNSAIRTLLSERLGVPVNLPDNPQIIGALGAALIALK